MTPDPGGDGAYAAAPDPIWTPPDPHQALRDAVVDAAERLPMFGSSGWHAAYVILCDALSALRAALKPVVVDPWEELQAAWADMDGRKAVPDQHARRMDAAISAALEAARGAKS